MDPIKKTYKVEVTPFNIKQIRNKLNSAFLYFHSTARLVTNTGLFFNKYNSRYFLEFERYRSFQSENPINGLFF